MLEKKIADQLRNHEIDPQDAGLFEKIMQERSKRNSKTGFLLIGSIALMFTLITGLGLSNYWGKVPQDGYSKEDIAAIRKQETNQFVENNVESTSTQNAYPENGKVSSESTLAEINNTTETAIDQSSKNSLDNTNLKHSDNNGVKRNIVPDVINPNYKKDLNKTPKPINTITFVANNTNAKPKSSPIYTLSQQRVLKPLADLTLNEIFISDPVDQTDEPKSKQDGEDGEDANENKGNLYAFWPREINFFAGSYYNQRFINDGGNAIGQKIAGLETISSTYFIGLNAEYRIKKSIFGQIGAQWLTVNNTIHSHWNQTVTHRTETVVDPGGQSYTIDVYDTSQVAHAGANNTNYYFEIPLTIGARWQIKRHIIQAQFGFISSFYNNAKGTAFNDQGELQKLNGKQSMFRTMNIQAITGFTYTYLVGSRIGLYIQPNLRYGLTNQAKKSSPYSQYNSMVGGQFGLKYILK
ncbi:hypothetical protein OAB01_03265 [Bacteroidia bacterium]|nr:hypothetical protein [Bacteroidia bacterium]